MAFAGTLSGVMLSGYEGDPQDDGVEQEDCEVGVVVFTRQFCRIVCESD